MKGPIAYIKGDLQMATLAGVGAEVGQVASSVKWVGMALHQPGLLLTSHKDTENQPGT